ncbi:hypothetical protein GpartN1_g1428.t1 [Galdieria partita]|uniref:Uncharacterized protein n=1 Tax=Galdieria partita TaxID=83374 RepID=A0A9C7UNP6_9RHOD|nr:hypothetical protein GpartN1_g1428.t1 [Galdieria partita]
MSTAKVLRSIFVATKTFCDFSRRSVHSWNQSETKLSRPEYSSILSARFSEGFKNEETLLLNGNVQKAPGNGIFMVSGPPGVGLNTVVDEAVERFLERKDSWQIEEDDNAPRLVIDLDCKESSNPIQGVVELLTSKVFGHQVLSSESPLKVLQAFHKGWETRGFLETSAFTLPVHENSKTPAIYDEKQSFLWQVEKHSRNLVTSHPFHSAVQTLLSISQPYFNKHSPCSSVSPSKNDQVNWYQFCFVVDLLHWVQPLIRVVIILRNLESLLDPSHPNAASRHYFHDMLLLRRSKEGKRLPLVVTVHQTLPYVDLHPSIAPSEHLQIFPLRRTQTRAFLKLFGLTCDDKVFEIIYKHIGGNCGDLVWFVQLCDNPQPNAKYVKNVLERMKSEREERQRLRLLSAAEKWHVPVVDLVSILDAAKRIQYRIFVNGHFGAEVWGYDATKAIVESDLYYRFMDPPMIIPSNLCQSIIPSLSRNLKKILPASTLWWYRTKRLTGMYSLGPLKRPIERLDHLVDRENLRDLKHYDIPAIRFK